MSDEKLHYVFVFNNVEEDFIPVAVFNKKEDADIDLAARKNNGIQSGGVLTLTWQEFCPQAVNIRLKNLAIPLQQIATALTNPDARVKLPSGEEVCLYGASNWPVAVKTRT